MDSEDKYLVERFGRKQPFKVPEGYFEQFNAQLMEQLSANELKRKAKILSIDIARFSRLRPIAVAAVGAVLLVSGLGLYLRGSGVGVQETKTLVQNDKSGYNNGYIDQVADYTMVDNEDFYAYVADY